MIFMSSISSDIGIQYYIMNFASEAEAIAALGKIGPNGAFIKVKEQRDSIVDIPFGEIHAFHVGQPIVVSQLTEPFKK
jgi:hypothetical protein